MIELSIHSSIIEAAVEQVSKEYNDTYDQPKQRVIESRICEITMFRYYLLHGIRNVIDLNAVNHVDKYRYDLLVDGFKVDVKHDGKFDYPSFLAGARHLNVPDNYKIDYYLYTLLRTDYSSLVVPGLVKYNEFRDKSTAIKKGAPLLGRNDFTAFKDLHCCNCGDLTFLHPLTMQL